MSKKHLLLKRALRAALLVLLLSVVGMTNAKAQGNAPTGAINGLFSVSDSTQVYFSQGNLQYIGSASTPYWKFADHQWDYFGDNGQGSTSATVDRDLFGWGTSGYNHGAVCYQPWSTSTNSSDYYAYGSTTYNLNDQTGQADWGCNAISNGGNEENIGWRTLTTQEWNYVFNSRTTPSGIRYAKACVNDINGTILLPDNWDNSIFSLNNTNSGVAFYNSNEITASQWTTLSNAGAVFLPAAGYRGSTIAEIGVYGQYWSSSYYSSNSALANEMHFYCHEASANLYPSGASLRSSGSSVRLVRNAEPETHTYIDLGLPSGTLWATCNIGANSPEEYGDYFAWGETEPKEIYVWNYQHCQGDYNLLTKYCNNPDYGYNGYTDTLTVLLPEDDAATVNWGANWRMPTSEEWQELYNHCTSIWTIQNGVSGRLLTSTNGNTIFLPAAGYGFHNQHPNGGDYCGYWSSSLYTYTNEPYLAKCINFYSPSFFGYDGLGYNLRYYGLSVRPVRAASQVITTHWLSNSTDYEENMPVTAVVEIDGVEQQSALLELGAFCGEECRGSQIPLYFEPTQRYIYQMTVFGEEGDEITFRLYDHATNEELDLVAPEAIVFDAFGYGNLPNPIVLNFRHSYDITTSANPTEGGTVEGGGIFLHGETCTLTATPNDGYVFVHWTLDGEVVSTEAEYTFEVTGAGEYTARFDLVQTLSFSQGWNWWSTYIRQDDAAGLEALENGLGSNGVTVKSQNEGYVSYLDGFGWYGSLERLYNEQSYRIQANAACTVALQGSLTDPADHPVTLNPGWTWMGFPWNQAMSVEDALEGFEPEANDFIKGRNAYTMYYAENGYSMWFGPLNSLEPGQGYVYYSNSGEAKTLTLNTNDGRSAQPNVTASDNLFRPEAGDYADNMTLTAVVDFGGAELRSEDYEVAVFCNGECRGSAKLTYFAPTDSYITFLTLYGNDGDELEFVLTDGDMTALSGSTLHFATDGRIGTLSEPYPLCFGFTGLDDNAANRVSVYPNPSRDVFNIKGEGIRRIDVFNAFGQVVFSAETSNDTFQVDLSDKATGVYLLRVVTESGVTNRQLIKE